MPLIKNDYTYREALEITAETLPDEDPSSNLIEALYSGDLEGWIVCENSGTRYSIPYEAWKSSDGRFDVDKETSIGKIRGHLVIADLYTNIRPAYIRGKVQISLDQLDDLLVSQKVMGPRPSSDPTSGGASDRPPEVGIEHEQGTVHDAEPATELADRSVHSRRHVVDEIADSDVDQPETDDGEDTEADAAVPGDLAHSAEQEHGNSTERVEMPALGDRAPKGKPGPAEKWDWDAATRYIVEFVDTHPDGLPRPQAKVERLVSEFFVSKSGDGPSESSIRRFVQKILPNNYRK